MFLYMALSLALELRFLYNSHHLVSGINENLGIMLPEFRPFFCWKLNNTELQLVLLKFNWLTYSVLLLLENGTVGVSGKQNAQNQVF